MERPRKGIAEIASIRRPLQLAMQTVAIIFSAFCAFFLCFDFHLPAGCRPLLATALPVWLVAKLILFRLARLDRVLWRYVFAADLSSIAVANIAASAISCCVILLLVPSGFPRSIFVLDLLVCLLTTAAIRVTGRMLLEASHYRRRLRADGSNTLIYGAGDAGMSLLREVRNNTRLQYRIVGFLDDHPAKLGLRIDGVPVLGGGDKVKALVDEYRVEQILIAIPSAAGFEMTRILTLCHAAGVECKAVPGLGEIVEQSGAGGQIREVAVEHLLGRNAVRMEEQRIRASLEGKVVMVTGAAGSIGSELCRQIARFAPARIVGLDIAESPLFEIDREMRQSFPSIAFAPEIGSIQNRIRLDELLRRYRPSVLYHAAAYKHVPLMEENIFEAIENNVFGTYNVATAAARHGVEDFVMISSDKAVRPTNIMGATKRLAELLLLSLQNGGTQYVIVRFGNVLGSNGSVIPIFKKQIAAGGPVTVTHPEMRRFFMTIREACQLVLQASVMAEGGQICVLDMGRPVKIVDLARNLILLSGFQPDDTIKIEFCGLRPGEKLCEELSTLLEDTVPTSHEKIRIFLGGGMPEADAHTILSQLRAVCATRDASRLVVALKEAIFDYNPSAHLLKRILAGSPVSRFAEPEGHGTPDSWEVEIESTTKNH